MGCVYLVTNKVNGRLYVGMTVRVLRQRKYEHKSHAAQGANDVFARAIRKYSFEKFSWRVLYRSNDRALLEKAERRHIKNKNTRVPNGYNLVDGGYGSDSYDVSDVTKAKISKTLTGKKASLATRRKMSETHKKRHKKLGGHSEATRKKQSLAAQKRTPMSEETKEKIRKSVTGFRHTAEAKRKISLASLGNKYAAKRS